MQDNVVIIGGCGHVGLPLGVKFALAGLKTTLIDVDKAAVEQVTAGEFPFLERGGNEQLQQALSRGLAATTSPEECLAADAVIFVTGTPVDEHLNPKLSDVTRIFDIYSEYLSPGSLIVMRSTLFPGTMEHLAKRIDRLGLHIRLAFCPERVAQGFALEEIDSLPQIVSAFDEPSFNAACTLFSRIAPEIVRLTPLEAELMKLMANSWRYLEFAIANQFYIIAESRGVDFHRIYDAMRYKYPRAGGYKSPGLAAGPCLFKDTMQLSSYFDNQFYMGHSAMLINEGLAPFIVEKACSAAGGTLWGKTAGILGMTFKGDNDDIRESLSFKVKKGLEFKGATLLCHDPYLPDSASLETLLHEADVLVLCTPHKEYRDLRFHQPCIDVGGLYRRSGLAVYAPTTNEDDVPEQQKKGGHE